MAILWLYVVVLGSSEPFIEGEFPSEAQCLVRMDQRMPEYDRAGENWFSICRPLARDVWPVVRMHR